MNVFNGTLVIVEGIDGAGKSTLIKTIVDRFNQANKDCVSFSAIGEGYYGTEIKKQIMELFKYEKDLNNSFIKLNENLSEYKDYAIKLNKHNEQINYTFADLFMSGINNCIRHHVIPALEENKIVILDRYIHTTLAYQGVTDELTNYITKMWRLKSTEFPYKVNFPAIVVHCDISAEVSIERSSGGRRSTDNIIDTWSLEKKQGNIDRYENAFKLFPAKQEDQFFKLDMTDFNNPEIEKLINKLVTTY